MAQSDEQKLFDDLMGDPYNALVEQAVSSGRVPIGYSCSLVPEPLLSLDKLFPVRLRAQDISGTEQADYYMSTFVCSYSRSVLEKALSNGFDFLGGLVVAASCDHIRRAGQNIDALGVNADKPEFFTYILDTPRKITDPLIQWLANDFRRLASILTERYGVDTNDKNLREAIKTHNDFLALLKKIGDLRKNDPTLISGTEFHKIMVACRMAPKDMLIKPLEAFLEQARKRKAIDDYRVRLLILGSNCDNPHYTELIESQGALVVGDRYCWGSMPGLDPIPVEGDPYENLAKYYLNQCACPRMMERYRDRIDYALEKIKEFRVDGVVFENIKFCDMWGYEVLTIVDGLRKAGIPVVRIEREYPLTGQGQLRTRIQAFIESIEGKRDLAALQA